MENSKNNEENVAITLEKIPILNNPNLSVIEDIGMKEDDSVADIIFQNMEVEDKNNDNDENSRDSEFSITDSDEGKKIVTKSERMGGNLELEQWTPEAIIDHLGPVVDRATKVWHFINGKEKNPPLNYVIPCGAKEYLPEAYG